MRLQKRITYICLILGCVTFAKKSKAQDPHFSQYAASPLTLNPALTGKFDGDIRTGISYKNQWPTIDRAYQTYVLTVDAPILKNLTGDNNNLGVGFMAYSDKSANGTLNLNYFSGSIAYNKGLDEEGFQQIGIGLQGTYANQMVNTSKLTFADQLTPFGFTLATSENFNNTKLNNHYFDINSGILYTYSPSENTNYSLGVSGYHLASPKQNFAGGTYEIKPRLNAHAGAYFPAGDALLLHLTAMHSQQNAYKETLAGAILQFQLNPDAQFDAPTNFYAGSFMRFGDAVIPYVGLEYTDWKLGLSYDINVSKAKTATQSQGGVELSLFYIFRNHSKSYDYPYPKY